MPKDISPAHRLESLQVQDTQNVPSAISIAELLTGVKDKQCTINNKLLFFSC